MIAKKIPSDAPAKTSVPRCLKSETRDEVTNDARRSGAAQITYAQMCFPCAVCAAKSLKRPARKRERKVKPAKDMLECPICLVQYAWWRWLIKELYRMERSGNRR